MDYNYGDLSLIENEKDVKVYSCKDVKSIVIPREFNGKPVTLINNWALAGSITLESVVIPDTVTTIGGNAFAGCMSLKEIIIPKTVTQIGTAAFGGCESATIYAEAESKPEKWNGFWNIWERPVYWYSENKPDEQGNFWRYVNGKPEKW